MDKKIYREKSLKRVCSPEELNNYVRVVSPGTWIILIVIAVLLIGSLVWCGVTKLSIESVPCSCVVRNGNLSIYLTEENALKVEEGMEIEIADEIYTLPELSFSAVKLYEQNDSGIMNMIGGSYDEFVYVAKSTVDLPNGIYNSEIYIKRASILSFITN